MARKPARGLAEGEPLLAAMLDSALDAIVMTDESGRVLEFSAMAERMFGRPRAAALGERIGDLIVPPHLRERHAEGLARYVATGRPAVLGRRLELEGQRADGAVFPLELTVTEARLPDRRLFVAYLRDLSEQKRAAAEIDRQRQQLHQSEKLAALGSLLAGVAHELNNPLSVVIGRAVMLREAAADPAVAARAAQIEAAAERCGRIVRSFLAMARQRPPQARPCAPGELIDNVLELLAYGLRSAGVTVTRRVAPDAPAVRGDADQLHQVLANLALNAQQALEERPQPRRIEIAAEPAAGGSQLALSVRDNGPGVPAELRNRIFDPFFTTKPVGSGTGIGLSVCRGIVEAHGGRIEAAAAPEGGAAFTVLLPAATESSPTLDAEPGGRAPAPGGRSVLIVDDEPEIVDLLREILEGDGWTCETAGGGLEAQARLAAADFALVMSDLRMPDLDGRALHRWLAAERPGLSDRTVFITGDTLNASARRFLAEAGRPVLEKPFSPEAVRRIAREVGRL